MIILRQKNYSRFDLTPEEQEIWEKSIKRDGRKPKLKELIQQARKYKKGELSNKEFPNRVVPEMCEPEMCEPEMISMINKKTGRFGKDNSRHGDHGDVVRSRIAKKKLGKISRNVGIATLGTAALVGGGIAIKKARDKKKKKESEEKKDK